MCTKKRYGDKRQADDAIHTLVNLNDGRPKPKRSYWCSHCKSYHITSNSLFESGGTSVHLEHIKLWKKLLN